MQVADPGVEPDEERRLCNRALARWLISGGHARLRPGSPQMSAELVVANGRACAAVTAPDGQVLALYPVAGTAGHRRLYKAVPVPADPLAPLPRISHTAHAARPTHMPDLRAARSALASRSRALCEASALLRARSQAACAVASALHAKSAALLGRAA